MLSGISKTYKEQQAKLTIFHGKNKKNAGSKPALQSPYSVDQIVQELRIQFQGKTWGRGDQPAIYKSFKILGISSTIWGYACS